MNSPQAVPAPDPKETAAAQGQMNKETAVAQYGLAATNQKTPYGSLSYKQIGTWPDGTPRFESTTELSSEQQQLYNLGTQTQRNVGQIGVDQSARIGQLLGTPVNLNNEATEARLTDLGRKRLDPMFAQREQALETKLINQGVRPGTEAYARAKTALGQQQNDAYNQLYLSGRGQATQEALTERNQPINEITALLSGSQVQQPNFTGTPTPGVAPTDYLGAVNSSNQVNMANANAKNQYNTAMMNGLFGLGKTAMGGWMMSSRDTKKNIKKIGKLDSGLPVYSFQYKEGAKKGGLMQLGLMAQDVEKKHPQAVKKIGGVKHVNYSKVAEEERA